MSIADIKRFRIKDLEYKIIKIVGDNVTVLGTDKIVSHMAVRFIEKQIAEGKLVKIA